MIETLNEKYIGYIGKGARDSGSSLSYANSALCFVKSKKVSFVPRVVLYDKKEDIQIQTHVGAVDVDFPTLTENYLDLFMQHLAEIHTYSSNEILKYCTQNSLEPFKILTRYESLQVFGIERFKRAAQTCPDEYVINWIGPRLTENLKRLETVKYNDTAHLCMGDIGENLRTVKDKLFMIDWEFASLGFDSELSYIKIHSHPTQSQFLYMVDRYAYYSDLSPEHLYADINANEYNTRVNDVIWSAMKWGQNINNQSEAEKYKKMTYKRIKLCESKVE